jgi:hypothetical protein
VHTIINQSQVKSVEFKEEDWVLLKEPNYSSKNRKIIKGQFKITRVHGNVTGLKRTKTLNLVNTNLLLNYNKPNSERNILLTGYREQEFDPYTNNIYLNLHLPRNSSAKTINSRTLSTHSLIG